MLGEPTILVAEDEPTQRHLPRGLPGLFAANPNRPLARDWPLEATSHREADSFDRAIYLRMTRLRRKIEHDPAHPETIRVGYMFVAGGE
jgi:DNA-binding response OmpR family regulator